jgi:hypothetical protein
VCGHVEILSALWRDERQTMLQKLNDAIYGMPVFMVIIACLPIIPKSSFSEESLSMFQVH